MCLFLEMLCVTKCRNLRVCVCGGGGWIFPCRNEYFPRAENLERLFGLSGICWQNNQRKYDYKSYLYKLFYLIWGNICLKRERSVKKARAVRHGLFSLTFPFWGKYFPQSNHKLMKWILCIKFQLLVFLIKLPLLYKRNRMLSHN